MQKGNFYRNRAQTLLRKVIIFSSIIISISSDPFSITLTPLPIEVGKIIPNYPFKEKMTLKMEIKLFRIEY